MFNLKQLNCIQYFLYLKQYKINLSEIQFLSEDEIFKYSFLFNFSSTLGPSGSHKKIYQIKQENVRIKIQNLDLSVTK